MLLCCVVNNKSPFLSINCWAFVAKEVEVARGDESATTWSPLALPLAATVGMVVTWAVKGTGCEDDIGSAVVVVVIMVLVGIGSVQSRTRPGYLCRPSNTPSCP